MKLPPLNALRAFEAAARTGGFTSAAKELGVSSAAISQQVRKLESYLRRKVFLRRNNQLLLTDAGRDLYVNAAAALAEISRFTERVALPAERRALVISALPELAARWLPKRLKGYAAAPIRLEVAPDIVDLEADGVDVRLGYGGEDYAGYWVRPLFRDELVPLSSPALAQIWPGPSGFGGAPAVETDWGPRFSRIPRWADWVALHSGDAPKIAVMAPDGATALDLAEAGHGIALGQRALAQEAVQQGRLIELAPRGVSLPEPYVVIATHARLNTPRIHAFLKHVGVTE